jgi:RNA recognition motif-containing protein
MFTPDQNQNASEQQQQQYFQPTSPSGQNDEIRTVFLSGLPEDVKEREIHNLFRFVPGYEGCKMTIMNQRPVSFASFQTREFAASAIQQLNGITFDPNVEQTLRVEFARANSKVKRIITDAGAQQQEKRRRVGSPYTQPTYGYNTGYTGTSYDHYSTYGYNEPYSHSASLHQMNIPLSQHQHPQHSRLTPCTTLFVTGLDPTIGQNELISIFSGGAGFQRFLLGKDGQHCFLDYSDLNSSANALTSLNGYQVGAYRIKVDYAKKKMGETRNVNNREGNQTESHLNEQ